VCSHIHV
jgi:hypothetical protein